MTRHLLLAASVALIAAPAATQGAGAPYSIDGEPFATLQQAVDAIGAGQGTIVVADGRHGDCAVQTAGLILYRGETGGKAIFDGGACEGKATLVLRGTGARVEDLVFENVAVADGNGAGIRLETGTLDVARAWFRDSQTGILSGSDASDVTLTRSTFTRLGYDDGGPSHSIYFKRIRSLSVTNCRFEEGRAGHYVKSWAAHNDVVDSSFDDSGGRATNYMIDLPRGSRGRIAGNVFVQGADKENRSALIAVGAEEAGADRTDLTVTGNTATLAPAASFGTVFVADWSGGKIALTDNTLGSKIKPFERR